MSNYDDRLLVDREQLYRAATVAWSVLEGDPENDDARTVFDECSELLLFGESREAWRRPYPSLMVFPQAATQLVDEVLSEVGDQVVADQPIRVVMARQLAEFIDFHGGSSDDARYDALDILLTVLNSLKRCAEYEEVTP